MRSSRFLKSLSVVGARANFWTSVSRALMRDECVTMTSRLTSAAQRSFSRSSSAAMRSSSSGAEGEADAKGDGAFNAVTTLSIFVSRALDLTISSSARDSTRADKHTVRRSEAATW